MTQDYPSFPMMTVVEAARSARADALDALEAQERATPTTPALPSTPLLDRSSGAVRFPIFQRIAATVYTFLACLVGPETPARRASGVYQVITHLERYPANARQISAVPPVQAPRLSALDVLATSYAADPAHIQLLEVQRAPRDLGLDDVPGPLVASRRFDPRWPVYLRDAYRACVGAYGAWCATSDAEYTRDRSYRSHITPVMCEAWRKLEAHYLPIFRAWEADALELEAEAASVPQEV